MSIEYSNRVWSDITLKNGDLLVMLALAHHADGNGECWPGMPLLVEKTRLTDRQIRRVLNELDAGGKIAIEQRAIGRGKKPHYKLFPREKADNLSDKIAEVLSGIQEKADKLSQESGNNVRLNDADEIKADICDNKSGHLLHEKADICDTDYSHGRSETSLETSIERREEEKPHARDPLSVAWQQAYSGIEMPPKLAKSLQVLVAECGMAAAIHGIKASAAKEDGRNFRYIAECARNYVPPAPIFNYTNGNGAYHVDIPGIMQLQPSGESPPVAVTPPPPLTPIADPWAAALAELSPTLPGVAASYLAGSRMERGDDYEGMPLYRIVVEARAAAGLDWLNKQTSSTIRRTLGSILRQKIVVEIVATELEPTP